MLDDGSYDALVVDVVEDDGAVVGLDLVVVTGAHKGEVVSVHAQGLAGDAIDLLGMPATLVVRQGRPHVQIDD